MTLEEIKVKLLCNKKLCWYSAVLCQLDVELGESPMGTAHTDGLRIVVDPAFYATLSEAKAIGLLMHELRHVTDLHIPRREKRDPKIWNLACDFVINNELENEGFDIPPGGLVDHQYDDMSAEAIYEKLLEDPSRVMPNPLMDLQGDGQNGAQPSQAIIDAVKDIVIQATQQAEMQIKRNGEGSIPGSIARMVDEWVNPVLPWGTILRRYLSTTAKQDHSWKRPSRRYLSQGMYMPTLHSEQIGPIHIFIDASGSVSDKMFAMQVNQFKWIHRNLKPSELRIIAFDTKIQEVFTFKPNEKININFTGYGGTQVKEVVQYMQDNPCLCNLIFTDGYFQKPKIGKVQGDILCLIYDQVGFSWEGTRTLEIPREFTN